MLVIGAIALAGLRPWAATSKAPQVSVAPGVAGARGVEGALGEAVAVARDRTGDVAGIGLEAAVPATLVVESAPAPSGSGAHVAVAQLQPVAVQSPPPPPAPQPESSLPPGAPQGAAGESPSPTSAAAEPGLDPHGPIAAGTPGEPGEICEGDEDEVHLGDELSDLLELVESLVTEGNCVRVEEALEPVLP